MKRLCGAAVLVLASVVLAGCTVVDPTGSAARKIHKLFDDDPAVATIKVEEETPPPFGGSIDIYAGIRPEASNEQLLALQERLSAYAEAPPSQVDSVEAYLRSGKTNLEVCGIPRGREEALDFMHAIEADPRVERGQVFCSSNGFTSVYLSVTDEEDFTDIAKDWRDAIAAINDSQDIEISLRGPGTLGPTFTTLASRVEPWSKIWDGINEKFSPDRFHLSPDRASLYVWDEEEASAVRRILESVMDPDLIDVSLRW